MSTGTMKQFALGACVLMAANLFLPRAIAQDDSQVEARSARVVPGDGRPSSSITMKRLEPGSQEWFLAGSDLADALQVGRYWRADVRKLVIRVDDQRITFTVGARSVVGTDQTILLRTPVRFHQGEPWIPLEFVKTILPQLTSRVVRWNDADFSLVLGQQSFNVSGHRVESGETTTELIIEMTAPLAFRVDDSRAGVLVLKVYGARGNMAGLRRTTPRGLIDAITPKQERDHLLLEIELSELAAKYQSSSSKDGNRIVLSVEQSPVGTIPDPVPRGPHLVQTLPPEARAREVNVRKVVIDPGHGGADMGGEGVNGLFEKDVTLAIALEVKRILEGRHDIQVVLTRDSDETLGLVQRTEIANQNQGDVFISIHANSWYDRTARGIETYFLSPAKTEWDAQVARTENASIDQAEDLDFILWDLVQNVFIQESATLAEAVQNGLISDLGMRNRGVKQAGFRVLVGAFMPAILVEVGFLSNQADANKLADGAYHRQMAQAMADAILDFRARMDAVRQGTR